MHDLNLAQLIEYGRVRFRDSTVTTVRRDARIVHTFAQIAHRAVLLSQALAGGGVGRGDVLATVCRNHHEHLEVLFASHLLGACFAPLNNRVDDESMTYMLGLIQPAVVIADAEASARLDAGSTITMPANARKISIEPVAGWESYTDVLDGGARSAPLAATDIDEDDPATILFTGGTTGTPKGASFTQRELYLHTLAISGKVGAPVATDDTALILVPIFHGLGWQFPHQCWLSGANMIFVDGSLPGRTVIAVATTTGATLAAAVPTVWHDVVAAAQKSHLTRLGKLRKIFIGGAMTPPTLPPQLRELGAATYNSWGMTETFPVTISLVDSPDPTAPVEQDTRACRPIPGLEVRTTDQDGDPSTGSGQLEVRAPWISGHYLGEARPTSDWFPTGDVGVIGSTGEFTILGRAKEVIKSGGEQIWPATIEGALLRHPHVAEAAVIEIPHERWGGQPMACVVLRDDISTNRLREFLLESLPKWQVPTVWAVMPALPLTAMGKADRRALTRMYESGSLTSTPN